MNRFKRFGIVVLIAAMVMSQMSFAAFAEDEAVPADIEPAVEELLEAEPAPEEPIVAEEPAAEEEEPVVQEEEITLPKASVDPSISTAYREEESLNYDWEFVNPNGETETVEIPHSWEYFREGAQAFQLIKECTYTRTVDVEDYEGMDKILKFEGVNKVAVIYIDGKKVATHKGGFSTFYVDITKQCEGKSQVELKVAVSNLDMKLDMSIFKVTDSTMPVDADFTHWAGIYRDVTLIAMNRNVHLSTNDYGSDGVYVDYDLDDARRKVEIRPSIMLDYDFDEATEVTVENIVHDSDNNVLAQESVKKTLSGRKTAQKVAGPVIRLDDVHLWQGTDDPYVYGVDTIIYIGDDMVDGNVTYTGFRNFEVKNNKFYLNGVEYPLRGVGMHQEIDASTNVRNDFSLWQDVELVKEMGANALRTAHYPHSQHVYHYCDVSGIVVWNEIPFYLLMLDTDNFRENTMDCATEMVKQGYNHPSIIVWGLNNEVNYNEGYDRFYSKQATSEQVISYLKQLAKHVYSIDSTRFIGSAAINNNEKLEEVAQWYGGSSKYTTVGFNIYQGWYDHIDGATEANKDKIRKSIINRVKKAESYFPAGTNFMMTEYGAGANIDHHINLDSSFKWGGILNGEPEEGYRYSGGDFHPEEYQSYVHEADIRALYGDKTNGEEKASVWASFAWCMFDFSCYRNEGGTTRLNTKGLIKADHKTKKDAFYLYKANWNKKDIFVHINSSRYTDRDSRVTPVRVYSNCDTVELTVNGKSYGKGTKVQDGVFAWDKVALAHSGEANSVVATGTKAGETYTDEVNSWVYNAPSADEEEYVITYMLQSGKNSSSNKNVYTPAKGAKLYKPTKKGYTFVGWYTNSARTKKITSIAAGKAEDITLYAKWKANTYTIRFKGNGATSGKMKSTKATYNRTKVLPANKFQRKGYKFVGWSTKKNGKAKIYKNKARVKNLKTSGTVTLYARWKKK